MISKENIHHAYHAVIDMLYPLNCSLCDEPLPRHRAIATLCYDCWDSLDFCGSAVCCRCAQPIPALEGVGVKIPKDPVCAGCMHNSPTFDRARAVFFYSPEVRDIVMKFKYADRTDFANLMAGWLSMRIGDWLDEVDYVIPVPLHYFRLVGRRYNQAMIIATALCRHHGAEDKLVADMLVRHRYTYSMKRMTQRQRYDNLRQSISVHKDWHGRLQGKSVLVLDDVYTGGATFSACAGALRKAGADKIYVASVARVLLHR